MDQGAFIMHRCHGASSDINPDATRAVTKLKATITQRFVLEGCEVDAESDCRFCFFWERGTDAVTDIAKGEWRARYVRHWYEKDKLIPVNPNKVPKVDEAVLAKFPPGYRYVASHVCSAAVVDVENLCYRYLSYCQEATLGIDIILDMPGHRREDDTPTGRAHDALYMKCKTWMEGGKIDF